MRVLLVRDFSAHASKLFSDVKQPKKTEDKKDKKNLYLFYNTVYKAHYNIETAWLAFFVSKKLA